MKSNDLHNLLRKVGLYRTIVLMCQLTLILFSCSSDNDGPAPKGEPQPISICLSPGTPGTRIAGIEEMPSDLYVDDIWLLIYDADNGKLLEAIYTIPVWKNNTYYIEESVYFPLDTPCLVYGLANTHNKQLFDAEGNTSAFNTVDKLKAFTTTLNPATAETDMWALPSGETSKERVSLLMHGVGKGPDAKEPGFDASATTVYLDEPTVMYLYRIPARIGFECIHKLEGYTVQSVQLKNVPAEVSYFAKETDTPKYTYIDYKADEVTMGNGKSMRFVWYLPWHNRGGHNTAAPEHSTYIEVKATNSANKECIYRFYPHAKKGEAYNFNLYAGSSYTYTGYVEGESNVTLADAKHWSVTVRTNRNAGQ